jgi:hypothetical protein
LKSTSEDLLLAVAGTPWIMTRAVVKGSGQPADVSHALKFRVLNSLSFNEAGDIAGRAIQVAAASALRRSARTRWTKA